MIDRVIATHGPRCARPSQCFNRPYSRLEDHPKHEEHPRALSTPLDARRAMSRASTPRSTLASCPTSSVDRSRCRSRVDARATRESNASSSTALDGRADEDAARRPVMTPSRAWRRMWTKADAWHAHAISGAAYTALGAGLMVEWAAEDVAALASGGGPPPPVDATLVGVALALATTCAFTGIPLSKKRGWRKTELSARSIAFQTVLTWECARFGGVVDPALGHVPILDAFALAFVPFVWQTITSAYIALATEDDKRAAFAVWLGTLGFGAQIFPAQRVLDVASVATLEATRPGLPTVWAHGTFGLVWLLNWSTFGASLRARDVVSDDAVYVSAFLLRPSLFWLLSFALDVASRRPFHGIDDYITSALGAR